MSQTKAQLLNPLGELELTGQLVGVGATFSGNVSIAAVSYTHLRAHET